jgi:hypothetical protein
MGMVSYNNVKKIELFFRSAQKEGIWAWDCVYKEAVLIFPTVLGLLGDNPMHSEFACHIGLRGKYFCRTCWVKGSDAQDGARLPNIPDDDTPGNSPAPSALASEDSFENVVLTTHQQQSAPAPGPPPTTSTANAHAPKRGKYKESMTAMFNRISAFVKVFQFFLKLNKISCRLIIMIAAGKASHQDRDAGNSWILF